MVYLNENYKTQKERFEDFELSPANNLEPKCFILNVPFKFYAPIS